MTVVRGMELALLAAAAGTAGLSVVSLWWVPVTVVLSWAAGCLPRSVRTAAGVLTAAIATGAVAVWAVPSWITLGDRFVLVLVGAAVLPWFAGRFRHQYRALVRNGWERAEQLEREQELIAEQARLQERARIAQDMHDLLGHDLSLIALSAGALKLAPGLSAEHRDTAGEIRTRAGAAVDRLGEVIGILRQIETPSSHDGVADLVDGAAAAGLAVTLLTEGECAQPSPVAERAVHRVVQEALTNAAKHAPKAAVTVVIRHSGAGTEVRVDNDRAPSATTGAPSGGRGLIGLDERVRLAGGSITYGPREGGFTVVARIPHGPGGVPAAAAATSGRTGVPQEQRRARRRVRRTARAAVLVPVTAVALLGVGLRGWDLILVRASVVAPKTYARIHLGQSRAELAGLLPEEQAPHHAADGASPGPGTGCEYYAMTANPFDDDSGDLYRLCFRGDRLVSKQVVTQ